MVRHVAAWAGDRLDAAGVERLAEQVLANPRLVLLGQAARRHRQQPAPVYSCQQLLEARTPCSPCAGRAGWTPARSPDALVARPGSRPTSPPRPPDGSRPAGGTGTGTGWAETERGPGTPPAPAPTPAPLPGAGAGAGAGSGVDAGGAADLADATPGRAPPVRPAGGTGGRAANGTGPQTPRGGRTDAKQDRESGGQSRDDTGAEAAGGGAPAGPALSAEQADLVRRVLACGDLVRPVVGPAGTGKTEAMRVLAGILAAAGHPVFGTAHGGRQAEELAARLDVETRVVAGWLTLLDHAEDPVRVWPAGSVLIVDEATQVGTRDAERLIRHATRTGTVVVALGDPASSARSPPAAGSPTWPPPPPTSPR